MMFLCAGFPCQTFSVSGKQKALMMLEELLFFEVAKIIKIKNPKVIFLENVRNHDNGRTFRKIENILADFRLQYFL